MSKETLKSQDIQKQEKENVFGDNEFRNLWSKLSFLVVKYQPNYSVFKSIHTIWI